ncbi:unnamed protein product [Spirodela intermedia]|uniref:Exostosin GT47 domain-containing protein n=1 Tax=Spirodela intermedia TaxID=51605 RepID=A0A7I8L6K7_SPIIN|nr:unnamed protein product [Spirodela intermedia]
MRTSRRRRRRWDRACNGSAKPFSLLGSCNIPLAPPLLLLFLSLAAVTLLFCKFASLGGGATTNLPVGTPAAPPPAPPSSTAASINHSEPSLRAVPSFSGDPPLRNAAILSEGGAMEEEKSVEGRRGGGPYHEWGLFREGFEEMMKTLKIFVYPDARNASSPFAGVFLPHPNPSNPKLGNYYSEHIFKLALLHSSLLTSDHQEAHLFFMPFSINALRNDPRYAAKVSREFVSWNASGGVDHFYVSCHSVGRDAAARHRELRDNAIHACCSSSYFQRNYVAHKDVALPQIWPRQPERTPEPPGARKRLVFFAGRIQNSQVRRELISQWGNDTSMDVFSGNPPFPYEEGFRRSRFCLHVKGYEVNTARISDSIHYGCVPVILSNYYELPFASVLDWSKFSVIINHRDIVKLKQVLISFPPRMYLAMYENLLLVRRHFVWHVPPKGYDSFHMTVHQLWLRRMAHLGHVS